MIPHPKPRSSKWISTCFEGEGLTLPVAQTASTEYFLSNSNNPVYFHQAVLQIPRGAIVLEIGARALLSSVVKRTMQNELTPLALMKQDHDDNIGFCLANLGKCYLQGVDLNPLALHPKVQFPVPLETPMLSSTLSKMWDHSVTWPAPKYSDYCHSGDTTDFKVDIAQGKQFSKMADHEVDGEPVLPETAYVYFTWKALAKKLRTEISFLPVEFKDVRFLKRTTLSTEAPVTLKVRVSVESGMFEVCNMGGELVCTGRVYQSPINPDAQPGLVENRTSHSNCRVQDFNTLDKKGFYRVHKSPGYRRRGSYQNVARATVDFSEFTLDWEGDWICFLDAMVQAAMCALVPKNSQEDIRLRLAGLGRLTIDPCSMHERNDGVKSIELRAVVDHKENKLCCRSTMIQHLQAVHEMVSCTQQAPVDGTYCFIPHSNDLPNNTTPNHVKALYSSEVTLLGRDASGFLGDGRRVMAALPAACRTQADVSERLVVNVPDQWTLEQAATVPTAYSAAYYLCEMKSRLRPGDTILVMDMLHPVGQAVARLARHKALNVIGAVQNDSCKSLIVNNFPEFPPHKVICRDGKSAWIRLVAELAGEQGVDMIVSTLTPADSRDSLTALNKEGTFLCVGDHAMDDFRNRELGKLM
ncbi:fatty acid synthase [Elysia marginata]|uniref:Fatty acid synthase n=1 Tax=Elysia marginata TaxID=1093978 RepID=A0AAV4GLA0_9GAST|nr:fatty acid synthase [Elysia marginata]